MNDMIKIEKDSGRDMTPRLIGETYMKYPTETSQQRYRYGLYECQYCGKEFEAITRNIKKGNTRSCGCLLSKNKGTLKHNLVNHKFYAIWNALIQRCNNSKNKNYKDYGGRGISVCEEWLDVKIFIEWAEATHPNTEGMSLDRIDNDKGYSPDNCRWANKTLQGVNQRIKKNNTSGYVGVHWDKSKDKWVASIKVNKVGIKIGSFLTIEEAVQARDNYIIQNNLPHKLSTDYKEENK